MKGINQDMKLALIDDDQEQLQLLCTTIHTVLEDYGIPKGDIQCFSNSSDFFATWQSGFYDIIILDIYIDETDGVEIAQKIRETDQNVALAFCTSSNEFASQSYEVNARYYLQKPITKDKIKIMLQRINLNKMESRRGIQLPDGYRFPLRKLIYTNYVNHVITFYIQGVEPHSIYMTQTDVTQLLTDSCFYAANKGTLVNFHMVKKVTEDSFFMKDGTIIPIARRRYKEAKAAYTRFHFEKLNEEVDY